MAFSAAEIANINNAALEEYIDKGKVYKQNVANKPMLAAFDEAAGGFSGGNLFVSVGVKGVGHEGSLVGYTHDDQVGYYNPKNLQRAKYPWKEHHIGIVVTHTELKIDGIEVVEDGADQSMNEINGAEEHRLAKLLDEKLDDLGEDYAYSKDLLLHGDGTADAKAFAGIRSLILDNPGAGSTGGLSRTTYPYWRNRAATAAAAAAGTGNAAVASSPANGGSLIDFLSKEARFRNQFKNGSTNQKWFCGSDFLEAYKREYRANGYYFSNGPQKNPNVDISDPEGMTWDPTLDNLGLSKRAYCLDISRNGLRLLYLNGKKMLKHNPARPFDRYTWYNGMTTTCVLTAKQLNTSAVYDIS